MSTENNRLFVSFNTILFHIRNCRRLTRSMVQDIHSFDDFYKIQIIEAFDEIVCALSETLETIHEVSELKYPLITKER